MLCGTGCKNVAALEREGQITIKRYQRDHARADFVRVQGDRESVAFWAAKLMQDYPAKGARLVPGTGYRDAVLGCHRADGTSWSSSRWGPGQRPSLAIPKSFLGGDAIPKAQPATRPRNLESRELPEWSSEPKEYPQPGDRARPPQGDRHRHKTPEDMRAEGRGTPAPTQAIPKAGPPADQAPGDPGHMPRRHRALAIQELESGHSLSFTNAQAVVHSNAHDSCVTLSALMRRDRDNWDRHLREREEQQRDEPMPAPREPMSEPAPRPSYEEVLEALATSAAALGADDGGASHQQS